MGEFGGPESPNGYHILPVAFQNWHAHGMIPYWGISYAHPMLTDASAEAKKYGADTQDINLLTQSNVRISAPGMPEDDAEPIHLDLTKFRTYDTDTKSEIEKESELKKVVEAALECIRLTAHKNGDERPIVKIVGKPDDEAKWEEWEKRFNQHDLSKPFGNAYVPVRPVAPEVTRIENMIASLPEHLTYENRHAILEAAKAYDDLSEAQQPLVTNHAKLKAALSANIFDYYLVKEIVPVLTHVASETQTGLPNDFLAEPLAVLLTDKATGEPLIDMPVTFSVAKGGGMLTREPFPKAGRHDSFEVLTNKEGKARMYYRQADGVGTASQVEVQAGTQASVVYSTTTVADNGRTLPVWWKWQHFKRLDVDPDADDDGDGFTNLEEYLAGTNPKDFYDRPGGIAYSPVVHIEKDQVIVWPENKVQLEARVHDPNGGSLKATWSVTGPGEVTFEEKSGIAQTVTFSAPGTYMLRLAVSNAHATTTAMSLVHVVTSSAVAENFPTIETTFPITGGPTVKQGEIFFSVEVIDPLGAEAVKVNTFRDGKLVDTERKKPRDTIQVKLYRNGEHVKTLTEADKFSKYRTTLTETALGAVAYTAVVFVEEDAYASSSVCRIFYPAAAKLPPPNHELRTNRKISDKK